MTKTGRYRHFPIIGTFLIALSLYLFSHLGVTTPFWGERDLHGGARRRPRSDDADAAAGGAELPGVRRPRGRDVDGDLRPARWAARSAWAIFGTIFNNRLAAYLPKHVPTAALGEAARHGRLTANPTAVKHLPGPVRAGLRLAFSDSLHVVFPGRRTVRGRRLPADAPAARGAAAHVPRRRHQHRRAPRLTPSNVTPSNVTPSNVTLHGSASGNVTLRGASRRSAADNARQCHIA